MSDKLSQLQRSNLMASIGQKNTSPEVRVRRLLHMLGYRFRLHRRELPGTPDIVLSRCRLCIFVNGCFWHQHEGCKRATVPTANADFWRKKFAKNAERDVRARQELEAKEWRVAVIWECETKDANVLLAKVRSFL
jgi:DNA mismatch endonuclease (patch repair protein)